MDRRDSWGGGCSLISSSLRWLLRGVGWFQPCLVTEAREGSRSHVHVPPAPASTQEGWAPSLPAPRSFQFLYAPGVRLPAPGSQGKLSECAGVAASEPTSHLSVAPKQKVGRERTTSHCDLSRISSTWQVSFCLI